MKLNLKNRNFYFALLIICKVINLSAQQHAELKRELESYFEQLQHSNGNEPMDKIPIFYPIYEPFAYQANINEERYKSGATCKEFQVSKKLSLLQSIYITYIKGKKSDIYNLIDENGKKIYDILKCNCSPNAIGKIDTINQIAIIDLLNSYEKWYKIVKAKGLEKTQKDNISPMSFSKYKWVKEIGYISGMKTNEELLKIFLEIKKDTIYLNYFIKNQDLYRYYKDKSNTFILNELLILTLLNNQILFTSNILNFSLHGKESDIAELVSEIIISKGTDLISLKLKEKNISVILKV